MMRTMQAKIFCIVFMAVIGGLFSCKKIEYEDVSDSPKYKGVIDKCFLIKEDVWVTAITLDNNAR